MVQAKDQKSYYDQKEDILDIELQKKDYWKSIELPNGIIIDIAKEGSIISIEILKASKIFLGDNKKVIEMAKSAA
ncbi:MAG: DUF2283 domain-containing protein [Candidatus Woesearchaeota archaeon]|nr:DUF2283 domain-containing protein [Candidatus Woesearchaeota archaeon]